MPLLKSDFRMSRLLFSPAKALDAGERIAVINNNASSVAILIFDILSQLSFACTHQQ